LAPWTDLRKSVCESCLHRSVPVTADARRLSGSRVRDRDAEGESAAGTPAGEHLPAEARNTLDESAQPIARGIRTASGRDTAPVVDDGRLDDITLLLDVDPAGSGVAVSHDVGRALAN